MEYGYTDYLFLLALYRENIPLDRLLFQMDRDTEADGEAGDRAKAMLTEMERKNLVFIEDREGDFQVRLTGWGRSVSDSMAERLADKMVDDWNNLGQPAS